jgi:K+ transporter
LNPITPYLSTHPSACSYYLKHVLLVVVTVTLLPCDVFILYPMLCHQYQDGYAVICLSRLVISTMYAVHSTQSILYNCYQMKRISSDEVASRFSIKAREKDQNYHSFCIMFLNRSKKSKLT